MATNEHSGYPLKWFKDQYTVRNAYECAICLEVLEDPVQVRDCGHQFCALCIDDILKRRDPRCPSCRIVISDEMIFKDHAARRLIKQLVVNCCNEGCSWQGCLSLLQGHQSSCNFLIPGGDNIDQLKVEKLEEKHETLVTKVSAMEEKHEQDIKELKLKYEQDITELRLKHEQDIKELKLQLEQSENRWQRIEEKQELYEKEKKTALKQSENPWQRPEKKEKEVSKEERKTAELYRNVVAILNKLTPQNFTTLVKQIMALNFDTPERLEGVIDRIFEKAIGEPMFSVAYANMYRCLFTMKVADAKGKDVSFRKLLLNRCQNEFEKALLEKYNQLEGLSEEERKIEKQEMDESLAKNKRRMFGNVKFIGELYKLKLLTENIIHDCLYQLLCAGDEESLENMCILIFTIGKDFYSCKAKPRIEQYFDQFNKIIVAKKVSSRVIFMLRDVIDCRQNQNKWIPRREQHYNPKTIDQIHKEAQMEKIQEQRLAAQFPAKDNKQKKGRREGPKPISNGGFIITAGKGGNKLYTERENTEEISLNHRSPFGQWGRRSAAGLNNSSQEQDHSQGNRYSATSGTNMPVNRPYDPRRSSSAGSRPSSAGSRGSDKSRVKSDYNKDRERALEAARAPTKPQVTQLPAPSQEKQEAKVSKEPKQPAEEPLSQPRSQALGTRLPLSEEELVKKTTALIDEYTNVRDLTEAITCFTGLHSPNLHHLFILTAVEHTYEMSSRARYDTGKLFAELLSQKKLSKEQLTTGFNSVLELANDNAIDYPMLWKYLAEIITPVILGDLFTLSDLKPQILEHLIPVGKAAALLAEILLTTKELKGEIKAVQIWTDLGISWSQVLPERLTEEDFLSRKNLNFLPNGNNDELLKLLRADQFKNDSVFAHIELPAPSQEKHEVKKALSEEEIAKKTTALIDEYANIRDLTEAIACFTDLHSPNLHHLFILTAVEHTYEMSSRARYDIGKLFAELLSRNRLSKEQFSAGFNSVLEVAYDNAIDYSMLWKYLAEIITPVILGGLFTLSDLKPQILEYLIPVGKAATLLAEILLITKELKGESKAVQIWTDLGISWSQVLPGRLTEEDFLSRKNLHFLPSEKNVELLKLLRADQFKNDTVIPYIEKNFKEEERKEAQFISQLVTAVAESCIINKDQEVGPDCCQDKLKARKDILRKYLDNNNTLELQALFALQEIYVKYNKPAAMLSQFFNTLYDEEVITEEAFMTWKRDENPLRQEGKAPALQTTASFFEWLQSAAVEGIEN